LALTTPLLTQFLSYTTTPTGWVLLLSPEPVGWFCHLQLYLGCGSRHCHGINSAQNARKSDSECNGLLTEVGHRSARVARNVWVWHRRWPAEKLRILVRGSKNSVLLEMEVGEQVVASRYAIRPVKNSPQTRFDFSKRPTCRCSLLVLIAIKPIADPR